MRWKKIGARNSIAILTSQIILSASMQVQELNKEKVFHFLKEAVIELTKQEGINISDCKLRIEYSRDEKFGDYSTPFALENKNIFQKAPSQIANLLISHLEMKNNNNYNERIFSDISITSPGFINFRMSEKILVQIINDTILKKDFFAKLDNPSKINLEFVSANPTGPLNIVSARACAYGDSLSNLLNTLGHSVEKEFYVNDYGNQVELMGVACILRTKELLGESIEFQETEDDRSVEELILSNTLPLESYRGDYIREIVVEVSKNEKDWQFVKESLANKNFQELIHFYSLKAIAFNLAGQKKDLLEFGVNFDRFFLESSLHKENFVLSALDGIKASGDIFIEEGKTFFKSTKYGDDKDRVIVRDDGRPTYLLADIAYHKNKLDRGYDEIIDIWGPDHHGYISRLAGAMLSMGAPEGKFKVIICQQVNLIEDGKKVKMSKRLGNFQRMTDLINYLGKNAKDVGRYFFTTRTAEAPLDFDLDLAKDESDKNPVFYLQYAHARICSIFREVGDGYSKEFSDDFEWTEDRLSLLFWIARFSEEIYDSAINREPHRIAIYLQNLAKSFTKFYGGKHNRLKDCDEKTRKSLAYLCINTQMVLSKGLELLGISAPLRMDKE
jgi:arginyl-tRNA synthetase